MGAQAVTINWGDHPSYVPGQTIQLYGTMLLGGPAGTTKGNDRLGFFIGNAAATGSADLVDGDPGNPAYGLAFNTSVWRNGSNQTTSFARNRTFILDSGLLAAGTPGEIGKTVFYRLRLRLPESFGSGTNGPGSNAYTYALEIHHQGTGDGPPSYTADGQFTLYEGNTIRLGFLVQKSPTAVPAALTNSYSYTLVDAEPLEPFPDRPNPELFERESNGPFRIQLRSAFGMNYTLWHTADLSEPPVEWTPLATYPGKEGSMDLQDLDPSDTKRFYKVERQSPRAPPPPPAWKAASAQHVTVYSAEGRFAGWPAACGVWVWGNEMLVGFVEGAHEERTGHTLDNATARSKFARTLDGGMTWSIEDGLAKGLDGYAHNHEIGVAAQPPTDLDHTIDFMAPGFAMTFRTENNPKGPAHFYYTVDRGAAWNGPYNLPDFGTPGIPARTDYIVNSSNELFSFLTAAKRNGKEGRVLVARTQDGGQHWERLAWIVPEPFGSAIMPSSVRLSESNLLVAIRNSDTQDGWQSAHRSTDNGLTWTTEPDPLRTEINSPAELIRLPDGRLVLFYVDRTNRDGHGATVCAKISTDDGLTWSGEILLRGGEEASWDVGYPVAALRPDGKLVVIYYWNNALDPNLPPYRRIEATLWDPDDQVPFE